MHRSPAMRAEFFFVREAGRICCPRAPGDRGCPCESLERSWQDRSTSAYTLFSQVDSIAGSKSRLVVAARGPRETDPDTTHLPFCDWRESARYIRPTASSSLCECELGSR